MSKVHCSSWRAVASSPPQRSVLGLTVKQQPKICLKKSNLNKAKTLLLLHRGIRRLYPTLIPEVHHSMWNLSMFCSLSTLAFKDLGWIFFPQPYNKKTPGTFLASKIKVCFVFQPAGGVHLFWPYKEKWAIIFELLQHLLSSVLNTSINNLKTKHCFQSWSYKSSEVAPLPG